MKHGKRIASGALALLLVLTVCVTTGVSAFAASPAQTATMQKWVDEGLLTGYEDGSLNEDGIVTRAEFIHLMNLIGFTGDASTVNYTYTDVETNAWYYSDIMSATAAGYVSGRANGSFGPRDTITRQEGIAMVVRAMGLTLDTAKGSGENCSEWFAGEIGAAITMGLYGSGTDFTADLTRAEAVSLLDAVRDKVNSSAGTTTSSVSTNVSGLVSSIVDDSADSTVTKTGDDITITKKSQDIDDDVVGDVTISSKLSSASYTLDDVTITGDLIIESTGTITLDDVTVYGDIIFEGSGAKVVLKSSAEVSTVIFHDSGTISGSSWKDSLTLVTVDTDSKYDVVYINVDADEVVIESRAYVHISSDVETLTVEEDAEYASVEITSSANIEEVNLEAKYVTLYGSGDIEQLNIDASYCTISRYLDIEDTDKASGVKGTSYSYIRDDDDDDDDWDDWDDDYWWRYDDQYGRGPENEPAPIEMYTVTVDGSVKKTCEAGTTLKSLGSFTVKSSSVTVSMGDTTVPSSTYTVTTTTTGGSSTYSISFNSGTLTGNLVITSGNT